MTARITESIMLEPIEPVRSKTHNVVGMLSNKKKMYKMISVKQHAREDDIHPPRYQ